jgi:hypothetical protein
MKKKEGSFKDAKAQSAMEYLMTYGWAILIIAVVLGALFQLGVFNKNSYAPIGCIPQSGFLCSNPVLSTSGVLTVTVGQAIAQQLSNVNVYFVPSGGTLSNAASASIGTLNMGQKATVQLQLPTGSPYPGSYTLDTPLTGYIYLGFTAYGASQTVKIGTLTTKVQSTSTAALAPPPATVPTGIVAYVPITIKNSQSTATPAPFQQMIQFSESSYSNYIAYSGNIANFEFFTQSGSVIPAWIERNQSGKLITWVKLASGIPASSSITIYLGFASKTTNLLSSSGTSGIGEAPQLSSTYAQYDDGASVFNNYWNFAGTSLPSGWTGGTSYTINNGLTISFSGNANAPIGIYTSYTPTYPLVAEVYSSQQTTSDWLSPLILNSVSSPGGSNFTFTPQYNSGGSYRIQTGVSGTVYNGGSVSQAYNTFTIFTAYITASSITLYANYGSPLTLSNVPSASALKYLEIGKPDGEGAGYSGGETIKWLRIRAYPPNGVMPSYSFGSVV